jgi:ATP-binding protein involved in chromosome partitioning
MAQKMPITATIVVTTPQDIALLDVGKSISMFNKLGLPCLGVVENMSIHICENCGHQSNIFGTEGNQKLKETYNLELLAKLPLNIAIREESDKGYPIAMANNSIADIYLNLAQKTIEEISQLPKDFSSKLGNISVLKN